MKYKLSRIAERYISSLDKPTRTRLKNAIEGLLENPPKGNIKPLQGQTLPSYRLRVGNFRIIYERKILDGKSYIYIKNVGTRGDIYK